MREQLIKPSENVVFKSESIVQNKLLSDKCISVELCPNRNLDTNLLAELKPWFCSVTWHNPSKTQLDQVDQIPAILLARQLSCHGYSVLLHVAGRNLNFKQALSVLNSAKEAGVRNIFALQGDPSQIIEKDDAKCDFPYAVDLVKFIKKYFLNYFFIGVAGYPEKHPNAKTLEEDIFNLKQKVDAGADFILTQASFEFKYFEKFSKLCKESSINVPIIPGIFIINSYKSLTAMSKFCSVPVPDEIMKKVTEIKDNSEVVKQYGIEQAKNLMEKIYENEKNLFNGIHIFSLNDLNNVNLVFSKILECDNKILDPVKVL